MKRTTLTVVLVLSCFVLVSSGAIAQGPQPSQIPPPDNRALGHAPGVVLVKFRQTVEVTNSLRGPATGKDDLDRLLSSQGAQMAERLMPGVEGRGRAGTEALGLDRIYRLRIGPGQDPVAVAEALSANPSVEYAEPDFIASPADIPQSLPSLPVASGLSGVVPNDPLYLEPVGAGRHRGP